MASKLLNLVALSSLAVLAITFGPTSTNALSLEHGHLNRHVEHSALAKKKRSSSSRCKVRSTTSSAPASTSTSSTAEKETSTTAKAATTTSKAAAKTTTSSKPASTSSSVVGNSKFGQKGSKLCAAYGDGNDDSALSTFKTSHMVGLYNWGPTPPADAAKYGWDFWTMLWGGDSSRLAAFKSATSGAQLGSLVLGFNEPNEEGQSNMDPQTAASLWKEYIQPLSAKGYKLCSPAMSSRPNGQQWMTDFMNACTGCTVDYQCVHWYDIGFDTLQTYLTDYHNQLGLPILLTEFADQNFNGGAQASMDEIYSFMGSALEFFDNTDWILAACPFGIMSDLQGVNTLNLLQASSGSPTDLGYMVINDSY